MTLKAMTTAAKRPAAPPSARLSGLHFGTDTGRAPTSSEWQAVAEQIIEAITS